MLRKGGRFAFQTVNPDYLARRPEATFEGTLPDGSRVSEVSRFDATAGVEQGTRVLEKPGGTPLQARWRMRYYRLQELSELFAAAGLRILDVRGSVAGAGVGPASLDLIALGERR